MFKGLDPVIDWSARIILGCFFLHLIVYLILVIFFPDSSYASFLTEATDGKVNFRWLDPGFWLMWFAGLLVILRVNGIFTTRKYVFLALVGFVTYVLSIVPLAFITITEGLAVGLPWLAGLLLFTLSVIWLGKLFPH